jgi:hypothetical protein
MTEATKSTTEQLDTFVKSMDSLLRVVTSVYERAQVVGLLVIIGGALSLILVFLAITPWIQADTNRVVVLALITALLLVSGTILYAFLNHLQYKVYVANNDFAIKQMELIMRTQVQQTQRVADVIKDQQDASKQLPSPTPPNILGQTTVRDDEDKQPDEKTPPAVQSLLASMTPEVLEYLQRMTSTSKSK